MRANFLLIRNSLEQSWLKMLEEALTPFGAVETEAEDKAIELILQGYYSLIIIDAESVEDVTPLITHIREDRSDARVMVAAASPGWAQAHTAFQVGSTEYIEKLVWGHSAFNSLATINDVTKLMRKDIEEAQPYDELEKRLVELEKMVNKIRTARKSTPLGAGAVPLPIHHLVKGCVDEFLEGEGQEFIECLFTSDPEVATIVNANEEWLKQAFDYIVHNAIRSMADSSPKKITVWITQSADKEVHVRIIDTGKGIPDHIIPRVLQLPIQKDEQEQGWGIGLLLARKIIQAYDGDIYLEGTGPTGTTFRVSLPLASEQPAPGKIL